MGSYNENILILLKLEKELNFERLDCISYPRVDVCVHI
jgi:hypothetical protein